jgi:galactofuranose transport system substrate-binding protein
MRSLKIVIFTALLMVSIVFPVSAQDDGALTIGFAQIGYESNWRTAFTAATLAEAEARGGARDQSHI